MLVTTTSTIQDKRVEYIGIVSVEVISGVNFVKDFFAGFRDFFGGRSKSYEAELERAKQRALEELKEKAQNMGANAVIGVDLDFEVLGQKNSMLMIAATGTAVRI